jgi:hypothetical protein
VLKEWFRRCLISKLPLDSNDDALRCPPEAEEDKEEEEEEEEEEEGKGGG